jgi:hypothetical protein
MVMMFKGLELKLLTPNSKSDGYGSFVSFGA